MSVNTVLFDNRNSSYIVVLKDETGQKILPIWVGAAEGNSIALALSDMKMLFISSLVKLNIWNKAM